MKHAAVLGAGAWGTALAKALADKGTPVELWSRRSEHAAAVEAERENRRYLPGAKLPPTLHATADLGRALAGADLVLVVVPSHALRSVMSDARALVPADAPIVSATKGIENDSLMLMSEVLEDVLGREVAPRLSYLSGPSFAAEVAKGLPTAAVVASADARLARHVQQLFASERLRMYTSDDPVGVEVGGALKNVIAIAAGACDGLGYGHNSRAALITRGLAEIGRVAMAKGGSPMTLAGLAGLGDLVLTCTGELSRNRTVGFEMGKGRTLDDVLAGLGHVAEGVRTAKSAHDLAGKLNVEMPITHEVYRVLYEGKAPQQAVMDLMTRELRPEF
jgi:glycerol-3-phosphate dehydrogenase (NAD(P)+)